MFKYRRNAPQVDGLTDTELNDAWKSWARQEEVVRLVMSIYVKAGVKDPG